MGRMITDDEFESLYRATAPDLFGYLRRRAAPDPEDLIAEVYAIAWRRRADLPSALLRRTWLFGTARNLLLAQARQRRQEQDVVEHVATLDSPGTPDPISGWRKVSAQLSAVWPRGTVNSSCWWSGNE